MRDRLEVENEALAAAFRAASHDDRRRVAATMVERALAEQDPAIVVSDDLAAQEALAEELDASADERDFKRARAAFALTYLRRAALDDALYEALHARADRAVATHEALSQLR